LHLTRYSAIFRPRELVIKCRLTLASKLLRDTADKFEAIAHIAGYGSVGTFSTLFKKHTGQRPGDYRDMKPGHQARPSLDARRCPSSKSRPTSR